MSNKEIEKTDNKEIEKIYPCGNFPHKTQEYISFDDYCKEIYWCIRKMINYELNCSIRIKLITSDRNINGKNNNLNNLTFNLIHQSIDRQIEKAQLVDFQNYMKNNIDYYNDNDKYEIYVIFAEFIILDSSENKETPIRTDIEYIMRDGDYERNISYINFYHDGISDDECRTINQVIKMNNHYDGSNNTLLEEFFHAFIHNARCYFGKNCVLEFNDIAIPPFVIDTYLTKRQFVLTFIPFINNVMKKDKYNDINLNCALVIYRSEK